MKLNKRLLTLFLTIIITLQIIIPPKKAEADLQTAITIGGVTYTGTALIGLGSAAAFLGGAIVVVGGGYLLYELSHKYYDHLVKRQLINRDGSLTLNQDLIRATETFVETYNKNLETPTTVHVQRNLETDRLLLLRNYLTNTNIAIPVSGYEVLRYQQFKSHTIEQYTLNKTFKLSKSTNQEYNLEFEGHTVGVSITVKHRLSSKVQAYDNIQFKILDIETYTGLSSDYHNTAKINYEVRSETDTLIDSGYINIPFGEQTSQWVAYQLMKQTAIIFKKAVEYVQVPDFDYKIDEIHEIVPKEINIVPDIEYEITKIYPPGTTIKPNDNWLEYIITPDITEMPLPKIPTVVVPEIIIPADPIIYPPEIVIDPKPGLEIPTEIIPTPEIPIPIEPKPPDIPIPPNTELSIDWLKDIYKKLIILFPIVEIISRYIEGIYKWTKYITTTIQNQLAEIANYLEIEFIKLTKSLFLEQAINTVSTQVITITENIAQQITTLYTVIFDDLGNIIAQFPTFTEINYEEVTLSLEELLQNSIKNITQKITKFWTELNNHLRNILNQLELLIQNIGQSISDIFIPNSNPTEPETKTRKIYAQIFLIFTALIRFFQSIVIYILSMKNIPPDPSLLPPLVRQAIDFIQGIQLPFFNLTLYHIITDIFFILMLIFIVKIIVARTKAKTQ